MAQVAEIEDTMMGGSVLADQSAAIQEEIHIKILQADIMDHLIVSALQEGGINRHSRFVSLRGQSGGKGDGVLFADTDINKALGKILAETFRAGPFRHGGSNGHDGFVTFGQIAEGGTEDGRIGRQAGTGNLRARPVSGMNLPTP